jgi:hypothetical protein
MPRANGLRQTGPARLVRRRRGGNGYYWVVGFGPENPACMEVRKLDSGMRARAAKPGEHYRQITGEKSGLWRNRGRAPQKQTGVRFICRRVRNIGALP